MNHSLITNIQRMCFADGPGLRTTVFMKGCTIHCPWCSNPENISFNKESYFIKSKCVINSDSGKECKKCKYNVGLCTATGEYGYYKPIDELVEEIKKDKEFFSSSGGGVTFSGGEALIHADYILSAMIKLKEENISIGLETALFVPLENIKKIIKYIDFFYIDVKILEKNMCMKVLGGDIELYYGNLEYILKYAKNVIFRVPCNDEYTLSKENMEIMLPFFKDNSTVPIEIFKTHNLAKSKYDSLSKVAMGVKCTDNVFCDFYYHLTKQGNTVERKEI